MTSEIQVYKLYHDLKNVNTDKERVAIVKAHDDVIRRECADITKIRQGILRVTLNDSWTNEEVAQSVLAAILGTEPAREES